MNIPMKYEDVVARLDAALYRESISDKHLGLALEREAALREELVMANNIKSGQRSSLDVCAGQIDALQQRLTVAEQRAEILSKALELIEAKS